MISGLRLLLVVGAGPAARGEQKRLQLGTACGAGHVLVGLAGRW